jgi:hypothetical protein
VVAAVEATAAVATAAASVDEEAAAEAAAGPATNATRSATGRGTAPLAKGHTFIIIHPPIIKAGFV